MRIRSLFPLYRSISPNLRFYFECICCLLCFAHIFFTTSPALFFFCAIMINMFVVL